MCKQNIIYWPDFLLLSPYFSELDFGVYNLAITHSAVWWTFVNLVTLILIIDVP